MAMNYLQNISKKNDGYVLVVALLVMAILSLLGIAGMNTSIFEMQVAGNDWNAKRTFYRADGGTSLGIELIEQSLKSENLPGMPQKVTETIFTINDTIWLNESFEKTPRDICLTDADVLFPWDGVSAKPVQDSGHLYFGGSTEMQPGGSLQMAAGYEGVGKTSAQASVAKIYDIYSRYEGLKNSQSIVQISWRHIIGTEE